MHNSQTRWISLSEVVERFIEQFPALKLYFTLEYLDEKVAASQSIYESLCNDINLCYFEFLNFILPYIVTINEEFQAESPKLFQLYDTMSSLVKTILEFYIQPEFLNNVDLSNIKYYDSNLFLPIQDLYLGPILKHKFRGNLFDETIKTNFSNKCLDFYIELMKQIYKQFPFTSDYVKGLKVMDIVNPKSLKEVNK